MSHYFDASPDTPSHPFTFDAQCLDTSWTFHSDHGVFAKDGLDFASRLLIEHVSMNPQETLLDLGCGIGVIGLILTHAYDVITTCTDVNERALALTRKNAESLQIPVQVIQSDGCAAIDDQRFDHIVTNPPVRIGKKALYTMLKDALNHLNRAGSLWVVMHKKHGVQSLIQTFDAWAKIQLITRKKGFKVLRLTHAVDDLTAM